MNFFAVLFFPTLVLSFGIHENEDPIVSTKYGNVKGSEDCSDLGRKYYAFKGIPYALPPIGELRFKAPREPKNWTETFDATKDADICIQKNYLFKNPKVEGSEDCLYLNVYTPKITNETLLPVMVFIHWGGFFAGSGRSDYLGPEYFMDQDVILVTFNYRLGIMGFLSTGDKIAPGNYALKDQVMALKWIQDNIESFGGNKNSVTIFGQSAGGASVHYHMLSPLSKNLFNRAISESGTALALWAQPLQPSEQLLITKAQALFVNCIDVNNSERLVNCLRNISAKDLVESGDKFKFFSIDPLCVYLPSIEENSDGSYLTKYPAEYIRNNEFNKSIPWIVGLVQDEGIIRAAPLLRNRKLRDYLNTNFDKLVPNLMALGRSNENVDLVWRKIKKLYFSNDEKINITNQKSVQELINLYTDRSFSYSTIQSVLFHSQKGHNSIWFYKFNYRGQYSYGDLFAATAEEIDFDWGVSHCDELLYLFKTSKFFCPLTNNHDLNMRDKLIKLWTNFAKNGQPMSLEDNIQWHPVLKNEKHFSKRLNYLNIEGDCNQGLIIEQKYDFCSKRHRFWEEIPLNENIPELDEIVPNRTFK